MATMLSRSLFFNTRMMRSAMGNPPKSIEQFVAGVGRGVFAPHVDRAVGLAHCPAGVEAGVAAVGVDLLRMADFHLIAQTSVVLGHLRQARLVERRDAAPAVARALRAC